MLKKMVEGLFKPKLLEKKFDVKYIQCIVQKYV